MKRTKRVKKQKRASKLIYSSALFQVLKFIDLEHVSQYQIVCHRFYDKIIPQYFNKMPVKRITKFYRFVYSKKAVQTFDLNTLDWSNRIIENSGWNNLVDNCQVIQIESGRIFLIGGHFSPNTYSQKVSEYIPKLNTIEERGKLNLSRTNFALCSMLGLLIFAVGGQTYQDEKIIMNNQTEKYYIQDDEWDVMIPTLNTPKAGLALCKFQNQFLYAFGGDNGKSKNNIVADIEKLDLEFEDDAEYIKWEQLFIKKKELRPFAFGLATLIDDDRILILGGRQNIMASNRAYIYNVNDGHLSEFTTQMNQADYFMRNGPQVATLYCQTFFLGTNFIHCWSQEKRKWIVASEAYQNLTYTNVLPQTTQQQPNNVHQSPTTSINFYPQQDVVEELQDQY
ncbi:kelch motif family protein [Stylonychia lemnae]|uniref:Kelch motif family protein n=1 Tax=Stylonychia lemnae TaxID=5949 RepID=A0A078AH75_STYLE|nr:kelch motif family protein [Stylonychia lemnae]|eukprot:CDW80193.1 kelch motif family protein [Stylonychia lemnae]